MPLTVDILKNEKNKGRQAAVTTYTWHKHEISSTEQMLRGVLKI